MTKSGADVDIAVVIRLMIAVFRAEQHDLVALVACEMRHRDIQKAVFRHRVIIRRRPCTHPLFVPVLVEQAVPIVIQFSTNALLEEILFHITHSLV